MKRAEISYNTVVKELEKLEARLERAEKKLEKATAKAEKYGVKDMTVTEYREWISTVETDENYMIVNKADVEKNGAYFDYRGAKDDVAGLKARIERTEERLVKKFEAYEQEQELNKQISDAKSIEEKWQLEFEAEQKEWAKDGITLEARYYGSTPEGRRFFIAGNCGLEMRSRHCFTLYIDGNVVFTSGYFWRAYLEIKNR